MFFKSTFKTNIASPTSNKTSRLQHKSKAQELLATLYYQMKRTKRRNQPLCRIHLKFANKSYYQKNKS